MQPDSLSTGFELVGRGRRLSLRSSLWDTSLASPVIFRIITVIVNA